VLPRVLALAAFVAGLVLAILGGALFWNLLSLRAVAASTRLSPVIWAVVDVRDEVSHRRA
jgi:hypothetical protein